MKFITLLVALLLACVTPARATDQSVLEKVLVLANRGNAEAQYHVGMLYNNGIGGAGKDPLGAYKLGCYYAGQFPGAAPLDPQQALDYKLFSAEAGYALAQHDVAFAYHQKADHAQAGKWWKLAAQQGFPPSAFNLSKWYRDGNVEARDLVMTYAWFKISQLLSRGKLTDTAQASLDTVAALMSSEQVQSAEKFVSDWRPTPTALTLAARDAPGRIDALLKAASSAN